MQWKIEHTSRLGYCRRATSSAKLTLHCRVTIKRTCREGQASHLPAIIEGRGAYHKLQFASRPHFTNAQSLAGPRAPAPVAMADRHTEHPNSIAEKMPPGPAPHSSLKSSDSLTVRADNQTTNAARERYNIVRQKLANTVNSSRLPRKYE